MTEEAANLLKFLKAQRAGLRLAAHGLTDEQAGQRSTVSAFSVGALIKHVTQSELFWQRIAVGQPPEQGDEYEDGLVFKPTDTIAAVLMTYDEVCAVTDEIFAGRGLDDFASRPPDTPYFGPTLTGWPLRWIISHLIEETARHAGHADIIRESIDGATAFELQAAATESG